MLQTKNLLHIHFEKDCRDSSVRERPAGGNAMFIALVTRKGWRSPYPRRHSIFEHQAMTSMGHPPGRKFSFPKDIYEHYVNLLIARHRLKQFYVLFSDVVAFFFLTDVIKFQAYGNMFI